MNESLAEIISTYVSNLLLFFFIILQIFYSYFLGIQFQLYIWNRRKFSISIPCQKVWLYLHQMNLSIIITNIIEINTLALQKIKMWSFWVKVFFIVYTCIVVRDPIMRGGDPINWFNATTFLCLSEAKTCTSKDISYGLFVFYGLRGEVDVLFVDIGGIVDHQCLIFLLFCWYWWNCGPSTFNLSFHTSYM